MNKRIKNKMFPIVVALIIISFIFGTISGIDYQQKFGKNEIIITKYDTIYIVKEDIALKPLDIKTFKDIIGSGESGMSYTAIRNHKYFGKYQISAYNIEQICDYDIDYFLSNPEVQEQAMDDLIYEYLFNTSYQIGRYSGVKIFDLNIDVWTILAGCHFVGYTKMNKWLKKPSRNKLYYQLINFNKSR